MYKQLWCVLQVVVLRDGHIVCTQKVGYEPQCAAINPAQNEVAVGGGDRVGYQCYSCKLTLWCFNLVCWAAIRTCGL